MALVEGKICTISIGASASCFCDWLGLVDAAAAGGGSGSLLPCVAPCETLCCSEVAAASEVAADGCSIDIAVVLLLFNWLLLEETFKAPSVLLLTVVRDSSKYSSEEDGVDSEDDD